MRRVTLGMQCIESHIVKYKFQVWGYIMKGLHELIVVNLFCISYVNIEW